MKTRFLPLLCLALTACEGPNDIKGQLTLQRQTTFTTAGGNAYSLLPATYSTQLKMEAQGAKVFIETNRGSVSFDVPGIAATDEGRFSLSAAQIGQEFGVKGQISINSQKFDRVADTYCVWDTTTHCEWQDDGTCEWIEKEIEGRQSERQVGEQRTKSVTIDLISRGKRAGQFRGNRYLGETIHHRENIGGCERRW